MAVHSLWKTQARARQAGTDAAMAKQYRIAPEKFSGEMANAWYEGFDTGMAYLAKRVK